MSPARWFASGPDIETAPSASGEPWRAILAATARARLYGSALVWSIEEGRAVLVRGYELREGAVVAVDAPAGFRVALDLGAP